MSIEGHEMVKAGESQLAVEQTNSVMPMIGQALSNGVDIAVIEKLLELKNEEEERQARKDYFSAFSALQSDIPKIAKNGKASFKHRSGSGSTEYSYVLLEDVTEAVKPLLAKYGLSYRYEQEVVQSGAIKVTCIVTHQGGHEERAEMMGFPDQSGSKNAIQQMASTVSYLRRYTFTGILGIVASEDDDGALSGAECAKDQQSGQSNQLYPQKDFERNFPTWKAAIEDGRKTPDSVFNYLAESGVRLTDQQFKAISECAK